MVHAKFLGIKETEKEIKNLFEQSIPFYWSTFESFLDFEQNEKGGIAKPCSC